MEDIYRDDDGKWRVQLSEREVESRKFGIYSISGGELRAIRLNNPNPPDYAGERARISSMYLSDPDLLAEYEMVVAGGGPFAEVSAIRANMVRKRVEKLRASEVTGR